MPPAGGAIPLGEPTIHFAAKRKVYEWVTHMPEPEKDLELNIALVKQLTGGDTFTGRALNENPVEFRPAFKLYINTNHLPHADDDSLFKSGRVKLIPFDRHFSPEEQDTGLKKHFRMAKNKSAILNWLMEGYRHLLTDKLSPPLRVVAAIAAYSDQSDTFEDFLVEHTMEMNGARLPTNVLYPIYTEWAKKNGYRPLNAKGFVGELRRRYDVRRNGARGLEVIGLALSPDPQPQENGKAA